MTLPVKCQAAKGTARRTRVGCLAAAVVLCAGLCAIRGWALEQARRINCAGNLKSMGLALRMYANDNLGHFPPSFRHLVTTDYLTSTAVYTCPSTGTVRLEPSRLLEFEDTSHSDYVYLGGGLTEDCHGMDPARTIIAHDRPGNHARFFTLCFANGAVRGCRGTSMEEIARRDGLFIPQPASSTARSDRAEAGRTSGNRAGRR